MTNEMVGRAEREREPDWLCGWTTCPMSRTEALSRFDSLPGLKWEELVGRWRGRSLSTGHQLDGLLELLGWYGKEFERSGEAHSLLFRVPSGALVSLDPGLMPTTMALRWPGLARSRLVRAAFTAFNPAFSTRRPTARLCMRDFRGQRSAAMEYHAQPITDHFRAADRDRLVGLMERRGMEQPFFFLLERDPAVA